MRLFLEELQVLGLEGKGLSCAQGFIALEGAQAGNLVLTGKDTRLIRITDAQISLQR